MVYLPEWAREGRVSVFHVESTREKNDPIIILFVCWSN